MNFIAIVVTAIKLLSTLNATSTEIATQQCEKFCYSTIEITILVYDKNSGDVDFTNAIFTFIGINKNGTITTNTERVDTWLVPPVPSRVNVYVCASPNNSHKVSIRITPIWVVIIPTQVQVRYKITGEGVTIQ